MASSRESSPSSESGATSPAQLTPNSKIKAMLAALDNESDDESLSGSARRRLLSSLAKKNELSKPNLSSKNAELEGDGNAPGKEQTGSESDEEEDIVRPKGRMAARMMADQSNSGAVELAGDNARERVRKMLIAKSSTPGTASNAEDGDGSDGSDVPVVSRKRKFRTPRRATPKSSPAKSPGSPSLFVSPQTRKSGSPTPGGASDSDDLPEDPATNDRFLALVKKKREERLARDAELAKEKAKKAAERKRHSALLEEDDDLDDSDENVERRLTQQDRPARKASKKALEEMHRETQRLSRNQQLAHNAITKKKFVKAGFFEKFNYRPGQQVKQEISRPSSSSSTAPHSDIEMKDTPPTSPVSQESDAEKPVVNQSLVETEEQKNDEDIPSLEEALQRIPSSPPVRLDKGKGKTIEEALPAPEESKKPMFTQRPVRVRLPKVSDRKSTVPNDSDSDLEIVSAKTPALKKKLDSMFDRVPVKQAEDHSFHTLRMLAHVTSPGKQHFGKNRKPSMTPTGMQVSLQQLARQQAAREKEEKLEALRAKGVIIQTAEEREMEMAEVEDLVAKARREGEEIMKREKAEAKKERKDKGEADPLGESSDDEDWEEDKQELDEELSVSGSEDEDEKHSSDDASAEDEEEEEENEEDEMALVGDDHATTNPLFDNEAAESEEDEDEDDLCVNEEMAEDGDVDEDEEEQVLLKQKNRRARKTNVISDDEEDEDVDMKSPSVARTDSPVQLQTESPVAPNSVLRSATKTFIPGVTVAGPAGLGLTQIFAGTMDDSQIASFEPSQTAPTPESLQMDSKQASLAFLRRLPVPELPPFIPTMEEDTQDTNMNSQSQLSHIPESQPMDSMTQGIQLNFSQSQVHEFDSLVQDSQLSPFPEATQDVGFQNMTPIRGRFVDAPPSTVDTVILKSTDVPETMEETPIVKKGKLRRRAQVATFSDEEEAGEPAEANIEEDEFEINESVFDVMRKASKKKVVVDEFDKKKSKAKEMVNEQAEESEDEYAGLGGASDDESGGEPDEFVKEMIDDEGGKDVDESKLAAFFADRERANDEKQVQKLYKDITNGMLRRKRGADLDLSDSDDGGEARQRMKRKEFAKMRKALLADERIGKIAENPKRQAFLRAIEDRGSEDEMDFLDDFAEQDEGTNSQSQSQGEGSQQVVPDSQPIVMGPPKRKHSGDAETIENRPAPHLRRTKPAKKPSNLSEIRESLSSLIEEPNAVIMAAESGSDTEDELEIEGDEDLSSQKVKDKENRDPFALRRTNVPIIDRISLKRASSNTVSNSTRLAFATTSATPGFKVPPLLRRATTNSSIASSTSSSVSGGMSATERMAGGAGSDGVRRGGGKNSGVHYFARESERRAAVVKTEKRREQKLVKGAQVRRKVVGGLFGGGKFE